MIPENVFIYRSFSIKVGVTGGLVKKFFSPYVEVESHMTAIKEQREIQGLAYRPESLTKIWGLLLGQKNKKQFQTKEPQICSDDADTRYLCQQQTPLVSRATHSR